MQQHQQQLARALDKSPTTYLSKVDSQQCYFETSSKTGEGVEDLFRYIQKTVLAQLQKQGVSEGRDRKGSKGAKPTDKAFRLDEDSGQSHPEHQRHCCGQ